MSILEIPQSKKIGEIKQLLIKKVMANELFKNKEELIDYLKKNRYNSD